MCKTHKKSIIIICALLCFLCLALTLCACSGGTGTTNSGNNTTNAILPTATIKLVPEINGLAEEGDTVCLSIANGIIERFDIVISIANPDRYPILSAEYYIEYTVDDEPVRTTYKVEEENFGYDSDATVVYIRNISLSCLKGSAVKVGFNSVRYKYKNETRAIAGISGTEFTVLVAPTFKLTMDISECPPQENGITKITTDNEYASSLSVKTDYEMNLTGENAPYGVDGYIFAGWYTEEGGKGIRYSSTDKYLFYSDITLYARYERAVTYSVHTSEEGEQYAVVTGFTEAGKVTSFTIDIPEEIDGYTVREIGNGAFSSIGAGKTFILPDTVYKIGDYAFNACTGLQIDLASVREIGNYAFANTGKIILGAQGVLVRERDAGLPTSLTAIGNYAFMGAGWDASVSNPYREGYYKNDLTLILPSTLKTLGTGAFSSSLFEEVYFRIGTELTSVGESIFEGSTALEKVYTSFDFKKTGAGHIDTSTGDSIKTISKKMFYNCTALTSKFGSETVKLAEGLKTIGEQAFASSGKGMSSLEYIDFPDTLEEIGTQAFANTGLTKVEFGTGSKLKVLGKWSFENSKFTEITLYSLLQYKESPFWGNTKLERINILTDNVPTYSTPDTIGLGRNTKYFVKANMLNGFRNSKSWNTEGGYFSEYSYNPSDYVFAYDYIVEADDLSFCYEPVTDSGSFDESSLNVRIVCVFGSKNNITVPATFVDNGVSFTVTSVGKYFVHENVLKVTLPSTLKSIEKYAFYASKLNEVKWSVGGKAVNLDAVSADELSLETIGEWAFYATQITKFYSNTNLKSIGTEAFKYCPNLSKIVLNKGTSLSIGIGAFSTSGGSVTSGTALAISKNVSKIGRSAFQDNVNLKQVYIERATVPGDPKSGYPSFSPFTGCNAIEAVYLFDKDALDPAITGSFASKNNTDGTANVYYGLKKSDGITSAYVLANISWTEAVKIVA